RWFMTIALLVLGTCHVITALGLRPARTAGRLVLGLGGLMTIGVAAFPLSAQGDSTAHGIVATLAFAALSLWPVAAATYERGGRLPIGPSLAATVVLVVLVAWFAASLGSGHVGLAERTAAAAQALWPLATVIKLRRNA